MAMLYMDSFGLYNTAGITQRWAGASSNRLSNVTAAISASLGPTGGPCLTAANSSVQRNFPAAASWVVGFRLYLVTLSSTITFFQLQDTGTSQVDVAVTAAGALQFTRNGTALGTSTAGLLTTGIWYYLEIKVTINNTTGAFEVRLNGVNVTSATGQNTRNSANNSANQLGVGTGSAGSVRIADLYVCDTSGSVNNNFLGDTAVKYYLPSGDGNYTQWTPSTGVNHYANVDETPPNDDTDYNSTATVNQRDSYTIPSVAAGTVFAMQQEIRHRMDDVGPHTIAPFVRISGTDYDSSAVASSTSYQSSLVIRETSPATSSAWTPTELSGTEFGAKLAS